MSVKPEAVHHYETALHDSFLQSLVYCGGEAGNLESPEFTQCIKAAGINFKTSWEMFQKYKLNTLMMATRGMRT